MFNFFYNQLKKSVWFFVNYFTKVLQVLFLQDNFKIFFTKLSFLGGSYVRRLCLLFLLLTSYSAFCAPFEISQTQVDYNENGYSFHINSFNTPNPNQVRKVVLYPDYYDSYSMNLTCSNNFCNDDVTVFYSTKGTYYPYVCFYYLTVFTGAPRENIDYACYALNNVDSFPENKTPFFIREDIKPNADLEGFGFSVNNLNSEGKVNLDNTLNFTHEIKNVGGNRSKPFYVDYYFKKVPFLWGSKIDYSSDYKVKRVLFDALNAGQSIARNIYFDVLDADYSTGNYTLYYKIDSLNSTTESNEINNTGFLNVSLASPVSQELDPDYFFSRIDFYKKNISSYDYIESPNLANNSSTFLNTEFDEKDTIAVNLELSNAGSSYPYDLYLVGVYGRWGALSQGQVVFAEQIDLIDNNETFYLDTRFTSNELFLNSALSSKYFLNFYVVRKDVFEREDFILRLSNTTNSIVRVYTQFELDNDEEETYVPIIDVPICSDSQVLIDDICVNKILGCTDSTARNYNVFANFNDGSCEYNLSGEGFCEDINVYSSEINLLSDTSSWGYGFINSKDVLSCFRSTEFSQVDTSSYISWNVVPWLDEGYFLLGKNSFTRSFEGVSYICQNITDFNPFYNSLRSISFDFTSGNLTVVSKPGLNVTESLYGHSFDYYLADYDNIHCQGSVSFVDGSPSVGCTDSNAINYDSTVDFDDGSCRYPLLGCTDSNSINYNSSATLDDGSCQYGEAVARGVYFDFENGVREIHVDEPYIVNYDLLLDSLNFNPDLIRFYYDLTDDLTQTKIILRDTSLDSNGNFAFPNGSFQVSYQNEGAFTPMLCAENSQYNKSECVFLGGSSDPNRSQDVSVIDTIFEIGGCTHKFALNYNRFASYNDGSCEYKYRLDELKERFFQQIFIPNEDKNLAKIVLNFGTEFKKATSSESFKNMDMPPFTAQILKDYNIEIVVSDYLTKPYFLFTNPFSLVTPAPADNYFKIDNAVWDGSKLNLYLTDEIFAKSLEENCFANKVFTGIKISHKTNNNDVWEYFLNNSHWFDVQNYQNLGSQWCVFSSDDWIQNDDNFTNKGLGIFGFKDFKIPLPDTTPTVIKLLVKGVDVPILNLFSLESILNAIFKVLGFFFDFLAKIPPLSLIDDFISAKPGSLIVYPENIYDYELAKIFPPFYDGVVSYNRYPAFSKITRILMYLLCTYLFILLMIELVFGVSNKKAIQEEAWNIYDAERDERNYYINKYKSKK